MAKFGDLFSIEVDEDRACLGIVAGIWKQELYVVVFKKVFSNPPDITDNFDKEILLAGLTLDAKFFHGHWKIVGSDIELAASIPQPFFKVEDSGCVMVESRDRAYYRKAKKEEIGFLPYRTVVAPVRIENAIRAYHGIGEWHDIFDELLFHNSVKTII